MLTSRATELSLSPTCGWNRTKTGRNPMTDVERLITAEEIKQLKARYFRFLDTKQWSEWEDIFTADATLDINQERPPGVNEAIPLIKGRENILSFVRKVLESVVTVHHGHMPE